MQIQERAEKRKRRKEREIGFEVTVRQLFEGKEGRLAWLDGRLELTDSVNRHNSLLSSHGSSKSGTWLG